MRILHFAFEKGEMLVWGESLFKKTSVRRGRPSENRPVPHPYSVHPEDLLDDLQALSIEREEQFTKGVSWMPSQAGSPLPSNPILGSLPQSDEPVTLSRFALWVCRLTPEQIVDFCSQIKDKEMLAPGILLGKEFSYLTDLLTFVHSLLIRQRYLPSVRQIVGKTEAFWTPVYLGQDKQRFSFLKNALPSACRAVTTSVKKTTLSPQAPGEILEAWIETMVDFWIRQNSRDKHIRGPATVHDIWLNHLFSENRTLNIDAREGDRLESATQHWHQPIRYAASSPFKLCFRVEEPTKSTKINDKIEVASDSWNVAYMLQAYDDPSLFVSVPDAWNPKGAN